MTPEERAEKIPIYAIYSVDGDHAESQRRFKETTRLIAVQIREAINEALDQMAWGTLQKEAEDAGYKRGLSEKKVFDGASIAIAAYDRGFQTAREMSAKQIESFSDDETQETSLLIVKYLASKVRALQIPEGK